MSARDPARDHYVAGFERFARSLLGEPAWLASLRREALAHFAEQGFPSTRQEAWRYTPLAPLARERFELAGPGPAPSRDAVEARAVPNFACSESVFAGGRFEPSLSTPRLLAGEVRVESLARLRAESPGRLEPHLGGFADLKIHPFAALNTAFLDDGAVLLVPEGAQLEQPMHVVFAAAEGRIQHPRVLVVAGRGSRVTVIQDHVSLGAGAGFSNALTELHVGPGARVDFVLLQRECDRHFHVSGLHARLERDAQLAAHALTLGGRLVRNDASVGLFGEGADCTLRGLFLGGGDQLVDNHTTVDHAVPRGSSRELYKGILRGRARGVFRGRIVVRPDAQGTSAEQRNPNLLLSEGAEVDSRPQLEIHADDVRCNHGASIGQLDETALFYLRTRGIGERAARGILTRGFAAEVLRALPVPALAEALEEALVAGPLSEEVAP